MLSFRSHPDSVQQFPKSTLLFAYDSEYANSIWVWVSKNGLFSGILALSRKISAFSLNENRRPTLRSWRVWARLIKAKPNTIRCLNTIHLLMVVFRQTQLGSALVCALFRVSLIRVMNVMIASCSEPFIWM